MNYMAQSYGNATYFYPDSSGDVGGFTKTVEAQTLVTLDYSQILAAGKTIQNVSFILDVQTNPQLIISGMQIAGQTNIVEFIVSGGYSGVQHQLSVVAKLSDATVRTDLVRISIAGDSSGCDPCGKSTMLMPIPPGYQQASLSQNGVYASSFIRYFVGNAPPLGANVMDQWYDTNSKTLLEYITDGIESYWYSPSTAIVPSGPSSSLYYPAVQGQTIFHTTIPDAAGQTYLMTTKTLVALYVNGVLYTPNVGTIGDYLLDVTTSTVTLNKGLVANDVVTFRIAEGT
jgi:hypothetical protein